LQSADFQSDTRELKRMHPPPPRRMSGDREAGAGNAYKIPPATQ
jgi:hypothetical protein